MKRGKHSVSQEVSSSVRQFVSVSFNQSIKKEVSVTMPVTCSFREAHSELVSQIVTKLLIQ